MENIWLLEPIEIESKDSILPILVGNYATRLFRSVQNLNFYLNNNSKKLPTILVVNEPGKSQKELDQITSLSILIPTVVISTSNANQQFKPQGIELLEKPIEIFQLIRSINIFIEKKLRLESIVSKKVIFKDLIFYPEESKLEILPDSDSIFLTPKETKILTLLLSKPTTTVSKKMLHEHVWQSSKLSRNCINTQITRLRQKLIGSEVEIQNYYGDGFYIK
ncbi:MAG: response regulator transcription factor [Oligoflexales bacterium]|nr:response regulator transcription factor [Oligoflexales bacterium]